MKTSIALLVGSLLTIAPTLARADGALLSPIGETAPTSLDLRVAVADGTHWSQVTVAGPSRVMWLVPARPGAKLDVTDPGWLDALDGATAPRIAPPIASSGCAGAQGVERPSSWGLVAAAVSPGPANVLTSADAARAAAAAAGYAVTASVSQAIDASFARGDLLVAVELVGSGSAPFSSPVLRVDDGQPRAIPLDLTGSASGLTRVTAFVFGEGPSTVPGAEDVVAPSWPGAALAFETWRGGQLLGGGGATWLRESSSHEILFDGATLPSSARIASVSETWLGACAASARIAAGRDARVGRSCGDGAFATVPGSPTCTPAAGAIDPSTFACGDHDELGAALAALSPYRAAVTRISGIVGTGDLGADVLASSGGPYESPVVRADGSSCAPAPGGVVAPGGSTGTVVVVTPSANDDSTDDDGEATITTYEGCSSSTVVYDETNEEEDASSADSCNSNSTQTYDDDSSSSSSDACGGSSSTSTSSSDDSGWDTKDDDSCRVARSRAHKRPSPVSRYALVIVFGALVGRRIRAKRSSATSGS